MLLRRASLLLLLASCSGPEPGDAGRDAGRDAAADAGRDAGRDAANGRDAGQDAVRDGGPTDPGWVPWATPASDCTIERALRPELLPAPQWEPCSEQPEGCLRTVPGTGGGIAPAWFDGELGYFRGGFRDRLERDTVTITTTDGRVVAAWRAPAIRALLARNRACMVWLGLGGGYASVVADYFDGDDSARSVDWVYHAPIDAIRDATEPLAMIAPGVGPQRIAVTPDVVAMWTGPAIWAIGADGRQARLDAPLPGIPQNVQAVGPDVFWEDWADLVRVAHATLDRPASLFHRADPGDIKELHTDGVEMAWLQGHDRQPDRSYARLELWAAPYVRDPALLAPRLVRRMERRNGAAYGGGWYVMDRVDHLEVVRTSDGTLRHWPAPGGVAGPPLYVSDREMLVQSGGLVRIDPHTLPVVE